MSARQALPSTLLRLCVICATSLQSMSAGAVPDHVVDAQLAQQDGQALAKRIHHDLSQLIQQIRKEVTALSLAMRPSAQVPLDAGPLDGVDDASVTSATQLLQSLASDVVPKLAFLANLATKHQAVYTLSDAAAHDATIQLAKDMGAQVMLGENARGPKVVSASVGTRFARAVHKLVMELVENVAELCQSFMDERTRAVLAMAQKKREGAHAQLAAIPPCSRETSLSVTKKLWTLCDAAQGSKTHTPGYIARLPRSNLEAMAMVWRQNELVMRDGLDELQEAMEYEADDADMDTNSQDNDLIETDWDQTPVLTAEQKETTQQIHALLKQGLTILSMLGKSLDKREYDCDAGADAVEAMAAAQDEVIAAVLYAEDESSLPLAEAVQEYLAVCRRLRDTVKASGGLDELERTFHALNL
ncbi:kynureninase [Malassezia caprae]|uniref:Kynureninase n=1 Tax=Malassezia caprae TaxID=1381934 RepID=A0AAF0E4I8_9BASI|nr:kynureninase [Malassezia caprae]